MFSKLPKYLPREGLKDEWKIIGISVLTHMDYVSLSYQCNNNLSCHVSLKFWAFDCERKSALEPHGKSLTS